MFEILSDAIRIFRVIRRPKQSEYEEVARVAGLGIVVVGLIGFSVLLISRIIGWQLIPR